MPTDLTKIAKGDMSQVIRKTVTIYEGNGPYYECPRCGFKDITRAFQGCIGCGARITWKLKNRTME